MDFPVSTEQTDATSEGLEPQAGARPSRAFFRLPSGTSLRLFLGLLLVSAAAVDDTAAQRDDRGFRELPRLPELRETVGVLEVASSIELERMLVDEVLAGGPYQARSLGTWTSGTAQLGMPRVETEIVRSVPAVWRMRLPDEPSLHTLDVRYTVVGNDGRQHVLTADHDTGSTIGVRAVPVPPAVVQADLEGTIIEGGLILYLDLAEVRTAGRYSGTITVTLDHF